MNSEKITSSINDLLDSKASKLNNKHKGAICAVILLLPCVLFYFLIFAPKTKELEGLENERTSLQKDIKDLEIQSEQIVKHRAEKKEAELRFQAASLLLPQKKEIPSLLTNISSLGTAAGLDFLSFRPQAENTVEFYAEIPVDIKVSGQYHNVGSFLYEVSKLPRIVNVANLILSGPKMEDGEMILNAGFKLVTYRFLEKKEVDEAAKNKKNKK